MRKNKRKGEIDMDECSVRVAKRSYMDEIGKLSEFNRGRVFEFIRNLQEQQEMLDVAAKALAKDK